MQDDFIAGRLRAIAATNAFGMGIDKPDVRLVVHADVPGSLENYLQEAGRAGRDNDTAHCVLLYTEQDIERQHSLTAMSRLTQEEINAVLKALRKLDRRRKDDGPVVATTGEILVEDEDHEFKRDTATDDTRARTAVSWLEEAEILSRHDNETTIFPASLRVGRMEEAASRLRAQRSVPAPYRLRLLSIVRRLINAEPDRGVSTDELSATTGLDTDGISAAMYDLARMGLVSNDTVLTAYVHHAVRHHSNGHWRCM